MKVFLLSLLGQPLFALLLFWTLRICTRKGSLIRRIGLWFILLELLLFLTAFFTRRSMSTETLTAVLRGFNDYYVGTMMFLCWTYIGIALIYLVFRFTRLRKHPKRAVLRQRLMTILFLAMIPITILLCVIGTRNTYNPKVVHHRIEIPKQAGVDSLRLALVTDIHVGEIITPKHVAHLAEMVRPYDPDYVLVGGDIIDYDTRYAFRPDVESSLRSLHHDPSHIIYILGNHEYYYHPAQKEKWLKSLGILLKDSVIPLADNLYLIGRDDRTNDSRASLAQLMRQVPQGAATILLDHQPSEPRMEREAGIDLALHGHTHDGQFIPFKWVVGLHFEKSHGLYKRGGTTYYVSSGFGVAGSPFRVGTHSEIAILDLHFAPSN